MGLEPTRCNHHKILSLARLPVPTLPRIGCFKILYLSPTHINIPQFYLFGKYFFEFFYFFNSIFILLNLYYILSHGTAYIRQRNHLHSKSHLKDIIPWSLQPCLTRHLLRSSFINIICLKFLSRFLLLFPHMPNIALSSGVHLSRSSFSPCDISHEIFLKIHIQTSVRQLWYHHANRQGSPHLSLISL